MNSPVLLSTHHAIRDSKRPSKLDAAVDAAYGKKTFKNDAERVAFLFTLYQQYTSLLPAETAAKKPRRPLAIKT